MECKQNSVNINLERDIAIFYSCGICNLNCAYCQIDKNPALKIIDDRLEESFKSDYYFNQVKKYFPNRGQLRKIETWGGEPFLKMERMSNLIRQLVNYYYYFDSMFSSTNFSFPEWNDKFFNLMNVFGEFPERNFTFYLQLSVDGPEYINDRNRGKGVTEKCLNNFNQFIKLLPNQLPKNVKIDIVTKGTLDNRSIMELDSKEKIIEYYQFLEENFIDKIHKLDMDNVIIHCCVPNTAVPSPVTKEIGEHFAKICKWTREIESENLSYGYFKYFDEITLFTGKFDDNFSYCSPEHTCGTGRNMIGFLPDGVMATCHESFTHLVAEYKKDFGKFTNNSEKTISFEKYISNDDTCKYCMSDCQYKTHELQMSYFNNQGTTFRLANMVLEIMTLALAGQVESKYINEEVALSAARSIQEKIAFCIKDNYNITGTFSIIPNGILKLLLNGALDYIDKKEN